MPTTSRVRAPDDVLLMVGTTKGAFFFSADRSRRTWKKHGPFFPGESVYAVGYDGRDGRHRAFAATHSFHWGSVLRSSDDFGKTWTSPERQNIRFPEGSGLSLVQVWQVNATSPDASAVYAGVEPACLFKSTDGGDTWAPVDGLLKHPHRERWMPGGGGLCLHTIVTDPDNPDRMLVAISTAGVYRTDDGGRTWNPRNAGVRAVFLPDKYPEFGQCVHKVVHHPSNPGTLYLQNHWGLYRSTDWGDSWTDIANGVPSDFGFCMAMHPHDPETVYIVPMESDQFRCCPEAKMRVYRTRDGGKSWKPLTKGLPQKDSYETVLRDAMTTDGFANAGVYVGTKNGKLFASNDDGDSWTLIADALPPIMCVKAATLAPTSHGPSRHAAKRKIASKPGKKAARSRW